MKTNRIILENNMMSYPLHEEPVREVATEKNILKKKADLTDDFLLNNPSIITRLNLNYDHSDGNTPPLNDIIDSSIEAERKVLNEYTHALVNKRITMPIKRTIRKHLDLVVANINLLKAIKRNPNRNRTVS